MITSKVIRSCLDEMKSISKVDLACYDIDGTLAAGTDENFEIKAVNIRSFIDSGADSQAFGDYHMFRVNDDGMAIYVVVTRGNGDIAYIMGRTAASELSQLDLAYREKFDKNAFFQNLLLDNMLLIDIYNKAKKLHIDIERKRAVYIVERKSENAGDNVIDVIKGLFSSSYGDYVTAVDEHEIVLIKDLSKDDSEENMRSVAAMMVDMINTEALVDVRVSYGTVVGELKEVSKSYKEARMAMDVGRIFYESNNISAYSGLGVGRLIYQLPEKLCDFFLHEVFGDNIPYHLDEETLQTIDRFFENNLNVSETSRQLYVHRNTLVYRIERLEKATGLDIRKFDEALTLKISLMVINYLEYLRGR